jgi:hypothetical protein
MDRDQRQMPVIVLMDKETSGDHMMIREWFENSRFSTCEASNVFDALEQLSDFTMRNRPDVVLLDVDCCEEQLPLVKNVADLPTVTIAGDGKKVANKYFHADLGKVASRLDELIPH